MVVDDSSSARAMIMSILRKIVQEEDLRYAVDGRHALQQASKALLAGNPFDLVLLDIEMPVLDGLKALDELIKLKPAPKVIMSSALTRRGAAASMQALGRGASDYVCKPTSSETGLTSDFNRELTEKVLFWCNNFNRLKVDTSEITPKPPIAKSAPFAENKRVGGVARTPDSPKSAGPVRQPASCKAPNRHLPTTIHKSPRDKSTASPGRPFLPRVQKFPPAALAIGCSTGGPQALLKIFASCDKNIPFPIFVTQHMPATFTTILSEQLDKSCPLTCFEAVHHQPIEQGCIYLAPGSNHMMVERSNGSIRIRLSDAPPVNFCKPAVDPMLMSLLDVYGASLAIIILTGMGQDGLGGCQEAVKLGARIIVQDEESSVVWGMPGAVAKQKLTNEVVHLDNIANIINAMK